MLELTPRLYHLLLETVEGNLSKGMRQLNGIYPQRINHRHRLSGHFFRGGIRQYWCYMTVSRAVHQYEKN